MKYNAALKAVTAHELVETTGTTKQEVGEIAFGIGVILGQAAMDSLLNSKLPSLDMSEDFSSILGPLSIILLLIGAAIGRQKRRPAWCTWVYVIVIGFFGTVACRDEARRNGEQRQKMERLKELRDKLKSSNR